MTTGRAKSTVLRYGAALLLVAAGTGARAALAPFLGPHLVYPTYLLAVLATARYFGTGPGIFVVFLSALAGHVFFTPPVFQLRPTAADFIEWAFYFLTALGAVPLVRAQLASRERERAAEGETRAILDSITDAFEALDSELRFIYLNAEAERLLGLRREELIGKHIFDMFPRLRGTDVERQFRRVLAERKPFEFQAHDTASDRWFERRAYPAANGGLAVYFRDVTARRQLEQELRQAQRLESLGVLAGGVAHDFNNLLTGILGNASLIIEDLPPEHPSRPQAEAIVRASESAAHLTQQLLAYAGKGRMAVERVDLSEVVRETLALIRSSFPALTQVQLELAPRLPELEADHSQMNQLVMNLVLNAAEAIEKGRTGQVAVRTASLDIGLDSSWRADDGGQPPPGQYLLLEVRDDGCGMDATTRTRIFEPFFTTKFMGRGLGLAAVHGILRAQGGFIHVESEPGHGSSFQVLLRAARSAVEGQREMAPAILAAPGQGSGLILVVDDEETVRETARRILEHRGYRVLLAENGRQAVELVRQAPEEIDLVLLDWTMPVMDGEAAVEVLRGLRPDLPVVVITGFSQMDAVRRFAGRGVTSIVQKPFTSAQLASELDHVLK
jgi:two-component system CheB/CheR fusion protein